MAVYCIFGQLEAENAKKAHARLQAAGKEITMEAIEAEVKLIHKREHLAPLRSSVLFQLLCILMQEMQEWNGKPKQLKEFLSTRFPDELKAWYRSPSKFVEELQKITPALQEEGITVGIAPKNTLVTLTAKGE